MEAIMKKRIFVVDAMAMAFRNFHAFGARQLTNSQGLPTSAVYGSAVFLHKIMQEESPHSLIIATDSKEKTFRHEDYPEYKAHRKEMPEELAVQIPYLYQLFEAMGLPLLRVPGLEADDLIGSLTVQASEEYDLVIVSGDKDFFQLLDHRTCLFTPLKGGEHRLANVGSVRERFGVNPVQVIDILGLMGDSADNVPGVPGIGEKGAMKLIQAFDSIEGIYERLDDVSNQKLRAKLEEHKDLALLSKKLVTSKTDAEIDWSALKLGEPLQDRPVGDALRALYEELDFTRLLERVKPKEGEIQENQTLKIAGDEAYMLVQTAEELNQVCEALAGAERFCFDTETTGLDIITDHPIGISLSIGPKCGWYIPLIERDLKGLAVQDVIQKLAPMLQDDSKLKVGHNLKFDIQMLSNLGLDVKGPFADTMVAAHLIEPTLGGFSLDRCCVHWLNYEKIPTSDLMGNDKSTPMLSVDIQDLCRYACEDADLTLRLYEAVEPKLAELELTHVFKDVEMPLVGVLARMEKNGVHLDVGALGLLSRDIESRLQELTTKIYEEAGEEFNINSTKQLQHILFEKLQVHEKLGVKRLKKTKSGFSTDASVLEKLRDHPLVENLLEYRGLAKIKGTYTDALPKLVNGQSHRIHTSFHQTGTATGRLSSSKPNLQNIPIRTPVGREIRKAFRSSGDDSVIVAADYSQIELRILAHLAGESNLAQAFQNQEDIHISTACKVFSLNKDDVTREQRAQAKSINFGLIYGMGPQRLARQTGVKTKEAKGFIDQYFAAFPGIKSYIEHSIQFAKDHKYVKTILGRRRPLPEIDATNRMVQNNAENMAVNTPIQGSAADLIKIAMVNIQNKLDESTLRAKMLLQVHDELLFECHQEDVDSLRSLVKEAMERALELEVPISVDVGMGQNWLEAH